jgi:4-hydroxybutyryl-CoA dehydratase/vinylacetyl-CoA-Delta-isomerase
MKTKEQYIESLRKLKPKVYVDGKLIESVPDELSLKPCVNSVGATYEYAEKPEHRDLFRAKSCVTGNEINVFCHMPQNADDLFQWLKMMRLLGREVGCIVRCVGSDAMRTLFVTTHEIDKKYGTDYHKRFKEYLKYMEGEDLTTAVMTDVWGDRSKGPHLQADPDLALHVVERESDGVVIRGVKAPITTSPCSHELIVMPTRALSKEDADWAVSFAVPANAQGVRIVTKPTSSPEDSEAPITSRYAVAENMIVFDDVFVPWERVFMCGESEFAGRLVELFTTFHRFACGTACKPGMADVMIGAAANMADYNGVPIAGHLREKLTDLILAGEIPWACGVTAAYQSTMLEPGIAYPDPSFANMGKLLVGMHTLDEYRILLDFAGGLGWAIPTVANLKHRDIKKYVDKYFKGRADLPTQDRIRMLRLVEDLTVSTNAGRIVALNIHGGGSPEAMRIMLSRSYDIEERKKLAKRIAGIKE